MNQRCARIWYFATPIDTSTPTLPVQRHHSTLNFRSIIEREIGPQNDGKQKTMTYILVKSTLAPILVFSCAERHYTIDTSACDEHVGWFQLREQLVETKNAINVS